MARNLPAFLMFSYNLVWVYWRGPIERVTVVYCLKQNNLFDGKHLLVSLLTTSFSVPVLPESQLTCLDKIFSNSCTFLLLYVVDICFDFFSSCLIIQILRTTSTPSFTLLILLVQSEPIGQGMQEKGLKNLCLSTVDCQPWVMSSVPLMTPKRR